MRKITLTNKIVLSGKETIFSVMKKLTVGDFRFQVVVKNKKLFGTVNDGDIRRAILRGESLQEPIYKCVNKNPIIGIEEEPDKYPMLLKSVASEIKYLPIVDKKKKLKYIIIESKSSYERTALIMAGGMGKRLGEKTKNMPKPLLRIGKKPILEHLLLSLEKADFKKIFISTYYLHEKIERFITKRKSSNKIELIHEKEPLGTAGSINLLPKNSYDNLTVLNGDLITDINLEALNSFHKEQDNDITITVAKYQYDIPFGSVKFDKSYNLLSLREKPTREEFVLSGIYCLSKDTCKLVKKRKLDMTTLIFKASKLNKRIGVFPIYEYWKDVGTPKDFDVVNKLFSSSSKKIK